MATGGYLATAHTWSVTQFTQRERDMTERRREGDMTKRRS